MYRDFWTKGRKRLLQTMANTATTREDVLREFPDCTWPTIREAIKRFDMVLSRDFNAEFFDAYPGNQYQDFGDPGDEWHAGLETMTPNEWHQEVCAHYSSV